MSLSVKQRGGGLLDLPAPEQQPKIDIPSNRVSKPTTKITKAQRAELRLKFGGHCAYCGCPLPVKGWHADHVEPVLRDFEFIRAPIGSGFTHISRSTGNVYHPDRHTLDNLFPACAPCNLFKATFSIEDFRKEISEQVNRARAYSVNFRTAERFGLIELVQKPVVFWFEQYNGEAQQGQDQNYD